MSNKNEERLYYLLGDIILGLSRVQKVSNKNWATLKTLLKECDLKSNYLKDNVDYLIYLLSEDEYLNKLKEFIMIVKSKDENFTIINDYFKMALDNIVVKDSYKTFKYLLSEHEEDLKSKITSQNFDSACFHLSINVLKEIKFFRNYSICNNSCSVICKIINNFDYFYCNRFKDFSMLNIFLDLEKKEVYKNKNLILSFIKNLKSPSKDSLYNHFDQYFKIYEEKEELNNTLWSGKKYKVKNKI